MRLFGGFSSEFQRIFCEEDAGGLPPFKNDEEKRREISRKDAKSFSCPQPLDSLGVCSVKNTYERNQAGASAMRIFHGLFVQLDAWRL